MRSLTSIALALALTTLVGQGQTSFGPSQEIAEFISYPRDTRAVDMDGDGDLDVISREAYAVKVIWWENDGDGNFSNRHVWDWDDISSGYVTVSLEDSNADGRPDVWIRRRVSSSAPDREAYRYVIALGDQAGNFGEPQVVGDFEYQDDGRSIGLSGRVADMNRDGRADLLLPDGIWMRQADGSFLPPPSGTFQPGTVVEDWGGEYASDRDRLVAIDDFDGDGDPDLVFGAPGILISFNLGDGLLAPPVNAGFMIPNEKVNRLKSIPPAAGETRSRLLVVTSLETPGVPVPDFRLALGSFSASGEYSAVAVEPMASLINAIAWDAEDDRAIVASYAPPATVHPEFHAPLDVTAFALSSSGSGFTKTSLFQADGSVDDLSLADFDGDGVGDLLFPLTALEGISGMYVSELRWYRNDGMGDFIPRHPPISDPGMAGEIVYAGDIDGDGDGDGDVITADKPQLYTFPGIPSGFFELVLWENEGGGTSFKRRVLSKSERVLDVIAVSDCDGDGDPDILMQTFEVSGTFEYYGALLNHGTLRLVWLVQREDGAFDESVKYENDFSYGLLESAKYLDWDRALQPNHGAPLPDVVGIYREPFSERAVYFQGIGTGFGPMRNLNSTHETRYGAWDDLDHDGDPDFSWIVDYSPSLFSFWLRNQNGLASPAEVLPRVFAPLDVDVDGDGFNDHAEVGAILLSRPDFLYERLPMPDDFDRLDRPMRFVDLDSDGDLDLLYPKPFDGISTFAALVWYENDGARFRSAQPLADAIKSPRTSHAMADIDGDGTKDLVVLSNGWSLRLEWFKAFKHQAPAGFANWMDARGLKGSLAGPLSDGDGDGTTNWEEFVFGSDPKAADPSHPSRPRLEKQGDAWRYSYQRRIGLVSPPQVQTSTDLKTWSDAAPATPSPQPAAPGYEWISEESNGEDALFFRTVILNPR